MSMQPYGEVRKGYSQIKWPQQMNWKNVTKKCISEISGSHDSEYEDDSLQGYTAIQSRIKLQMLLNKDDTFFWNS